MPEVALLVVSCPSRKTIQDIWFECQKWAWRDCPYPIHLLSPDPDVGWNRNLLAWLEGATAAFILLMLDDHFLDDAQGSDYTANVHAAVELMMAQPDIAMIKLQAGNAWPPEIPFPAWTRLGEYDRQPHWFKRTNLVPTLFRKDWLHRLTETIVSLVDRQADRGRAGALRFERYGTRLTENAENWPERMLGIARPNGGDGEPLISCIANDGTRKGQLRMEIPTIAALCS